MFPFKKKKKNSRAEELKFYFMFAAMGKLAGVDPFKFGYENAKLIDKLDQSYVGGMTEGHIAYMRDKGVPETEQEKAMFDKALDTVRRGKKL